MWLIGAVVIHDGVLSPLVLAVGWVLATRSCRRGRAATCRRGLIVGALVTVIAVPMIYREDTQPKSKAILQQNYGGNLTLLLAIIAAITLVLYAVKVVRDTKARPPDSTELPAET